MGLDDTEPEPAHGSSADLVQDIQDSFQAVLDALDAARANLYAVDERQNEAGLPPPSREQHSEPIRHEPEPDPERPRPTAPSPSVVEPPWARGTHPQAVPPPPALTPATMRDAEPTHEAPPVIPPSPTPRRPLPPSDQTVVPPSETSPPRARAHATGRSRGWLRFTDRRATRLAAVFGVGAVSGLLLASSLTVDGSPLPEASTPPAGQPDRPAPDLPDSPLPEIPGTGVLRQGDSGHGVYELQVRLLQVPNVYAGGAIDGRYGTELRAAVARFQQRYGIRGDESGVYGDNTRHALMLRTK